MKSSLNLAVLAVVFLGCVYGGVAVKKLRAMCEERKNQSHTRYL